MRVWIVILDVEAVMWRKNWSLSLELDETSGNFSLGKVGCVWSAEGKKVNTCDSEDGLQWASKVQSLPPCEKRMPWSCGSVPGHVTCFSHWNVSRHDVYHINTGKYEPGFQEKIHVAESHGMDHYLSLRATRIQNQICSSRPLRFQPFATTAKQNWFIWKLSFSNFKFCFIFTDQGNHKVFVSPPEKNVTGAPGGSVG